MRPSILISATSVLLLSLVACSPASADIDGDSVRKKPTTTSEPAFPVAEPSAPERPTVRMPSSCVELLGAELETSLLEMGMTFRPTDDTIQGRFSGIGNGEDFEQSLSCAYDYPSGVDGTRFEFGVEALTSSERDALLAVLRSEPGENSARLTEEHVGGDRLRFTQTGALVLETVPDDWTMTFVVFPDAWTMVWSPSGGADVLATQVTYSEVLERQLYSAR